MNRGNYRRLCLETLEQRCVLAGNVDVALSGNTLTITGDEAGNIVALSLNGGNLEIAGTDTTVTFNGNVAAGQIITIADFNSLNLKVKLNGGDDIFGSNGVNYKSVKIDGGAGADSIGLNTANVGGNVDIKTFKSSSEADLDQVISIGSTVAGNFKVRTGGGNDQIQFQATGNIKNIAIDAGAGDDLVNLLVYTCEKASIKLGDGANTLNSVTGNVTNKLTLRGGKGVDTVAANTGGTYAKIAVDLKDGNDVLTGDGFTVADIRVKMGKGDDTLNGNALNMTVFDAFDGGVGGNDTINFVASNSNIPVAGKAPTNFEVENFT